jgi:RNA polymerase sigma factor (sigma-70 family)
MSSVIDNIRSAVLRTGATAMTDGQLLERFVTRRDNAAFEALLLRHGPRVLGVCRRLLHHEQDAEDAFQATFLVLVRKAARVQPADQVGNFLYGVACHAARKARAAAARRHAKERQLARADRQEPGDEVERRELRRLLDGELRRLPAVYRAAVVLCDLGGQTRAEAARQLGWPEGTVAGRLARARALLARRLAQRGLALSSGALVAALSGEVSAGVPVPLVSAVLRAATQGPAPGQAVALANIVTNALLVSKLKTAAVVLLAAGVVGTGSRIRSSRAAELADPAAPPVPQRAGNVAGKTAAIAEDRLAEVLRQWEEATPPARECRYSFTWTVYDTTFNPPPQVYRGEVFISRPDRLRVEARDTDGKRTVIAVCAEGHARVYLFGDKKIFTFPFDPDTGSVSLPEKEKPDGPYVATPQWLESLVDRTCEEAAWTFLGFPVRGLQKRFAIRLEKEDDHWTYLRLKEKRRKGRPRPEGDWQVVLAKKGHWVRRIVRSHDSGGVVAVDFTEPRKGKNPPSAWELPFKELPADWKLVGWPSPPAGVPHD